MTSATDPRSLAAFTEQSTVNGNTATMTYTRSTATTQTTSAANRSASMVHDALGKPVTLQAPGMQAVTIEYYPSGAAQGLTKAVHQAARTTSYTYDSAGNVQTVTDPIGRVTTLGYDAVGRPLWQNLVPVRRLAFPVPTAA